MAQDLGGGAKEVDVKNYAKIEKIPGGTIEDCKVGFGGCVWQVGRKEGWLSARDPAEWSVRFSHVEGSSGLPATADLCVLALIFGRWC